MSVSLELGSQSMKLLQRFVDAEPHWKLFLQGLAYTMGSDAREYIKPFVAAKSVWHGATHGTGSMAESIKEDVAMGVEGGFAITFDGNFYGNYLDVGSPQGMDTPIYRQGNLRWPIGKRAGQAAEDITYSRAIHGVGHFNKDWPVHFSEKTAKWLAKETKMQKYCDEFMGRFLRELVDGL